MFQEFSINFKTFPWRSYFETSNLTRLGYLGESQPDILSNFQEVVGVLKS